MNWTIVKWVWCREMRDQWRDRRTMFTIGVLPMLLYPLMGLLMLQLAQVKTTQRPSIAIVGDSAWLERSGAEAELESDSASTEDDAPVWRRVEKSSSVGKEIDRLLPSLRKSTLAGEETAQERYSAQVEDWLRRLNADAIVCVVEEGQIADGNQEAHSSGFSVPGFLVLSHQGWERSRLTVHRLAQSLDRWHRRWMETELQAQDVPRSVWEPLRVAHLDSASTSQKQAFVWSKILPLILLVWALTGAFYPAVDLCAGEKERGTLETLLISPASRRELVWGKLLTVMSFSVVTALLNLTSMMVTTSFVFQHFSHTAQGSTLGSLGPISPELVVWLVLLVLPMSAMFSALAMAVASLARSTKEGQYYLMPLMLVGFPLVMLSVLPGMTLSAGTSMIPITGAILLSRSLMDGEYGSAMIYLPSVLSMTALCCLLAIRWAVRQFENESVLFSEVDKTNFKHWFVRIWLQRTTHPSATESLVGGLAILVALFFGRLAMGTTRMEWRPVAISTFVIQVGILLGPTLIMAIILTRSVNKALRWNLPRWDDLLVCSLLAVAFHPTYVRIAEIVHRAYPVGPETLEVLRQFDGLLATVPLWAVLAIFALLPALCEELAFRGFVFAGLLENKGVLRAIVGSSLLFGMSHGVLQQSICATLMGLVLGWLAYRTGGIACTFVFHFLHNAISMTLASSGARGQGISPWLAWALDVQDGAILYTPFWTHVSLAVSLVLLVWISVRVARPERQRNPVGWSATSHRSLAANTDLGS